MSDVLKTTSPRGELEWVTITGEGKENLSGKLQYTANLVLDPKNNEEHAAYLQQINDFWEENKPKGFKKAAKSLGYYLHDQLLDDDGDVILDEDGNKTYDPDGKVYLAFKTGTVYADGKQKKIKVFNAKAKEVNLGDTLIGNGSIGKIKGAMGIYKSTTPNGKTLVDAGVTLYLDRIQLFKLEEYIEDSGFEEEEGEFDAADDFEGEPVNSSEGEEQAAKPAGRPRI